MTMLVFTSTVCLLGSIMVFSGLMHINPAVNRWDTRTFQYLHSHLKPYSSFFRFIWPLGTTPVCILLILIIFISSWQAGLIVGLIYLIAAILEQSIKLKVNRPRPYKTLSEVEMTQPKKPHDPSHPSGDSMRVWFMALVFPFAFALPWSVFVFTTILAISLSLGRVILGVHYPLDVIGGTGFGLIATGMAVFIYQYVGFS